MAHMTTALAVAVQIGNAQMVLAATHTCVVGEWRPVNGRKDQEKNEDKIRGH